MKRGSAGARLHEEATVSNVRAEYRRAYWEALRRELAQQLRQGRAREPV